MSRADEIAQGLRCPTGELNGGLHVEDYLGGMDDFKAGNPPPKGITSASYDLGRLRAREKAEWEADFQQSQRREEQRLELVMRDLLADRPDLLAEYLAKMASISRRIP